MFDRPSYITRNTLPKNPEEKKRPPSRIPTLEVKIKKIPLLHPYYVDMYIPLIPYSEKHSVSERISYTNNIITQVTYFIYGKNNSPH